MAKWGRRIIALILLLLIFPGHVYAETDEPEDPGAGSTQDAFLQESIIWIFPEMDYTVENLNYSDDRTNITLDWESLAYAGKLKTADDHYVFVGIDDTTYILDEQAHDEYHPGQGDSVGFAFGLGHLKRLADCGTVWVEPGYITADAAKVSPEYPVVVAQDPDDLGVGLEYHVWVYPTTVYYEKWGLMGHIQACVNDLGDVIDPDCEIDPLEKFKCKDPGPCPEGYKKEKTNIWGCKVEQLQYKEGIASLAPGASLTQGSQGWILGPLAVVYPGTYLKHPVFGFGVDAACQWQGDVCYWEHLEPSVQVEDPGWYDLIISGVTTGTTISPPRSFSFVLGQFGVYLIESSTAW